MLWLVNMKKITPEGKYKEMIESYDLKDHNIWNATKGDMVEVRKTIREFYLKEQGYKCAYCRMEKKSRMVTLGISNTSCQKHRIQNICLNQKI